jgi:hypothetical protein
MMTIRVLPGKGIVSDIYDDEEIERRIEEDRRKELVAANLRRRQRPAEMSKRPFRTRSNE